MKKKRQIKDTILKSITYLSSGLSAFVLLALLVFVFTNGISHLNFELLTSDYWSTNYVVKLQEPYAGDFSRPEDLTSEAHFSSKWGVAFVDATIDNRHSVLIEYIDEDSPLQNAFNYSDGSDQTLKIGLQMERASLVTRDGDSIFAGNVAEQDAKEVAHTFDDSTEITSLYVKTKGGGIRGSIVTTLLLILISVLLALPIGIAAAIYLNEYPHNGKFSQVMRSMIELLSGVPSIIFGFVGVTVLFPLTAFVGITTTSVLLGGLTLVMMLLPVVIKSTEEALLVIPRAQRDASLALGATQSQTIFKVVIPDALPGILTAAILCVGRVIGESAALIYTMGTFVNDYPTLGTQGTSLAVHIWSIMSGENPNIPLATSIALVIMIIVLILNISVKLIAKRIAKKGR